MILDEIDNYKLTRKLIEKYAVVFIVVSIITYFANNFGRTFIDDFTDSIGFSFLISYYLVSTILNFFITYLVYEDMKRLGMVNWYVLATTVFSKYMGVPFFLILVAVYDKNTEYDD